MAITINVNLDEILQALKDDLSFVGNADKYIKVNATEDGFELAAVSGGGTWGSITGTLSDQTDLQNALNLKANLSGAAFTGDVSVTTSGSGTTLDLTNSGSGTTLNIANSGSGDFLVIDTDKVHVNNSGVVGIGTASAGAKLHVVSTTTSQVGQIIQAAAGQTANLLEINSSSGSGGNLFKVEKDGRVQAKEFWSVNSQNVSHYLRGYTEIRGQIGAGPSGQPLNVRTGLRVASAPYNAAASNNDPSAFVQIDSTTQGFLPPRMTGAQVEAISSPAEGLMAYATSAGTGDVTGAGWWGYNGSNWVSL